VTAIVAEEELPLELNAFQAVEAAYVAEIARTHEALSRGLPAIIECDKELTPYLYKAIRDRLAKTRTQCLYLDGRVPPEGTSPPTLIATIIAQLRQAVRGAVESRVLVLPHLDLLTSSSGGLTAEAREAIPLLYENPEIVWLGFKDPTFPVPKVIDNLFPHKETILGIPRGRLRYLVTQREARKFGRGLNPYVLYKYVSGVNAARLRRLLTTLVGEDYPADPAPAIAQLRRATLTGEIQIPNIDLNKDIGGYEKVKAQLQREIIDIMVRKESLTNPDDIRRIEGLIPRGMIFWGPPGTGKTLFAKAMASALGAAVTVVSGPELKSRWVGESEENLRQIFVKARQSAPAIIVFDELDSFASARGTYTGSGVEHSMVNQLLTEMDGFRQEELVFVVGTTNLVDSLDPALMRPGRFEFHLCVPYPGWKDRRAIIDIYNRSLGLNLADAAIDYAVRRTGDFVEGTNTRYSGDHIEALCRAIARQRLRSGTQAPTEVSDVEDALSKYLERPELTAAEERVIATHEAGHAVSALFCTHAPPIERISIRGDLAGALGFVRYADKANRYVVTRSELLDSICVLFGGREAEQLFCQDLSVGSANDLERATGIARALVEEFGMGADDVGTRHFGPVGVESTLTVSESTRLAMERSVREILDRERNRAREILSQQRDVVLGLRDLLLVQKVVDRTALTHLLPAPKQVANG
jgi:cell division protease FtsH